MMDAKNMTVSPTDFINLIITEFAPLWIELCLQS